MYYQLSAVAFLPVVVEVAYHRELAVVVVSELVYMPVVRCSFFVERIVKLAGVDAGKTGFVEMDHELANDVEELYFCIVFALVVEPAGFVAADFL